MLPTEVPAPSTRTIHFVPLPRLVVPTLGPLFSRGQRGPPELEQHAGLFPALEPPPAGAGTAVLPGQLAPLGASPQDPEDAFKTAPIVDARASPAGGHLRHGEMDADGFPLLLRESSPRHVLPPPFA